MNKFKHYKKETNNYIEYNLSRGSSLSTIKQNLIKMGHNEFLIDKLIGSIKNKNKIKKWIIFLMLLLFFSPFFVTYSYGTNKISFSLPHIHPGDEPHYLAMTSSIMKDFDLEVKNNYENAAVGEGDTGFNYRYERID